MRKSDGGAAYVHDTAVDVAKLLEAEETRAMGRVIEDEGSSGVDGDCTGVGRRIGLLAIITLLHFHIRDCGVRHTPRASTKSQSATFSAASRGYKRCWIWKRS
jgi:hypothetical protein